MKKFKNTIIYFILFTSIAICLGNQISNTSNSSKSNNELFEKLDLFARVLSIIQNSYVKNVDSKDLIYGALDGILSSLDPFSQFLPPKLYTEVKIDTGGEFGGLGIEVVIRKNFIVIVSALPGTPAEHAGLQSGDKIIKINGELLDSPALDEAVEKLRGKVGSKVEVTIYRPSNKQYFTVEMIREIIKIQSVIHAQKINDTSIGYIKITKFQTDTSKEFLNELEKLHNITGLIIDLRNNPGGLLEEGIKLSSILVGGKKLIVSTKGRLPEQNMKKYSNENLKPIPYPFVILINNGSASASEIVSGAVQDWEKGILIGETSFGKASVQSLIPLKDGSALRLTTAYYYTPKDRLIHENGIEPEYKLPLSKEDIQYLVERIKKIKKGDIKDRNKLYIDSQIQKAIEILQTNNKTDK